ncbi:MAG: Zn-ribbon domain-containing OB-fold protein [Acidimicrobiales bacterium]
MASEAPRKYIPKPYGLDAEFYRHALDGGGLHLQTCADCGRWQHPPRRFCGACTSRNLVWRKASGKAAVYSWTVNHFPYDPGWRGEIPYATVVAETAEGPRLVGTWAGPLDSLRIGQPIEIRLDQQSDDFAYLVFWPAD